MLFTMVVGEQATMVKSAFVNVHAYIDTLLLHRTVRHVSSNKLPNKPSQVTAISVPGPPRQTRLTDL